MAGKNVKVVVSKGGRIQVEATTGTNWVNASAAKAPSNNAIHLESEHAGQPKQQRSRKRSGRSKKKEEMKAKQTAKMAERAKAYTTYTEA